MPRTWAPGSLTLYLHPLRTPDAVAPLWRQRLKMFKIIRIDQVALRLRRSLNMHGVMDTPTPPAALCAFRNRRPVTRSVQINQMEMRHDRSLDNLNRAKRMYGNNEGSARRYRIEL